SAQDVGGTVNAGSDAAAITAKSFTQTAGSGTTKLSALTTKGDTDAVGGAVSITADVALLVSGTIDSSGGTVTAGAGKAGGNVSLTGGDVTVANITTSGSAGFAGADNIGGAAGTITIDATDGSPLITLSSAYTATGGAGASAGVNPIAGGAGGTVQFKDPVKLVSNTTVDSSGGAGAQGGAAGTGGDILFDSTINASTKFTETLGLTAGTGDIAFAGVVGGTTALGTITINSAQDVGGTVNAGSDAAAITAKSFTQTAGSGTTKLSALTTKGDTDAVGKAGGNVSLTGGDVTVGNITTSGSDAFVTGGGVGGAAGTITIDATDGSPTITLSSTYTAKGGVGDGAGAGGAGGQVQFKDPITLASTATINTSGGTGGSTGTGGDILFDSTINATTKFTEGLDLTAGTGDIAFTGVVGGTTALGAILINSAQDIGGTVNAGTDAAAITAKSFTQSAGSGTTRLSA
ncbi:MAG: hypothetical protein HYY78_14385, partial [Betaproteobacteria bacterium]|nr:hypothetical protein [Betaproteobacteria bacterium]